MVVEKPNAAFLSIPRELRDIIYSKILATNDTITLPVTRDYKMDGEDANLAVKCFRSLSRSCTQIHHEIEDMFFKRNTFAFLANAIFPAIPDLCVRKIRSVALYRTLMGKTFQLSIQAQQDGNVVTSVHVLEPEEPASKANGSRLSKQLEDRMLLRFMEGCEVTATMLRPAVAAEGGLSMARLKDVAARMNEQWLIGI
jgi:hypothetical protein